MLYFDSLASYPMLPEAKEALQVATEKYYANPSANHALGEEAHDAIEQAREIIADNIGALPSEIIFTSGATESNNIALKGTVLPLLRDGQRPHIITSSIEHKCILSIGKYLETLGCDMTYINPSPDGLLSVSEIRDAIRASTVLVSIMHVNNELGTMNPITEIGQLCQDSGIKFHTDAAQSFGKLPIDVDDMNIDFMSLSAHKIGGPKGIGAAYIRDIRTIQIDPVIHGAGHEFGLRGGTLATPLIESFRSAAQAFRNQYQADKLHNLTRSFLELLDGNGIKFKVNGLGDKLPGVINISFLNVDVAAVIRTTRETYCLSQGSACSAGSIEPSHVLSALGLDRELASQTMRLSFLCETSIGHINQFVGDLSRFKY